MRAMILIPFIALAGCYASPEGVVASSNGDVKTELLTTVDHCSVYRIWDGSNRVYFAKCEGHADVSWREGCGKNCTREMQSTTVVDLLAPVTP